jgi:anti-sigma regulatory factor (Ser/Thr protein kinase)
MWSQSFGDAGRHGVLRTDAFASPVDIRVSGDPESVGDARRAVTGGLAGQVDDQVLADAELLVSEMVTNSLQHADLAPGARLHVTARLTGGRLRLAVCDPGTDGTVAPRTPSLDGGGFGLNIVAHVADRWGVMRGGRTCVWAEMPADAPDGLAGLGVEVRR